MLVQHWQKEFADVYFLQERWNRAWSVKESCMRNKAIKEHLLFLHVFPDVIQHLQYSKGKASFVTICKKSEAMKELSEIISSPWSSQSEVGDASVHVFKMLYRGEQK